MLTTEVCNAEKCMFVLFQTAVFVRFYKLRNESKMFSVPQMQLIKLNLYLTRNIFREVDFHFKKLHICFGLSVWISRCFLTPYFKWYIIWKSMLLQEFLDCSDPQKIKLVPPKVGAKPSFYSFVMATQCVSYHKQKTWSRFLSSCYSLITTRRNCRKY